MRLVDPPITLRVLWGYVVPETPQGASKLDFIGALKFEPHTKVLSVNAFPNGKDTKYTVKGKNETLYIASLMTPIGNIPLRFGSICSNGFWSGVTAHVTVHTFLCGAHKVSTPGLKYLEDVFIL